MNTSKRYSPEVRDRAVRMVLEQQPTASGQLNRFFGIPMIVVPVQNYTNGFITLGGAQSVQANYSSVVNQVSK